jgi:hypothetical protein
VVRRPLVEQSPHVLVVVFRPGRIAPARVLLVRTDLGQEGLGHPEMLSRGDSPGLAVASDKGHKTDHDGGSNG